MYARVFVLEREKEKVREDCLQGEISISLITVLTLTMFILEVNPYTGLLPWLLHILFLLL